MKDQQAEAKQDTEMEAQRVIKEAEVEIEESFAFSLLQEREKSSVSRRIGIQKGRRKS